jgi:hypothetical protein
MSELEEKDFTRKCKAHRLNRSDRKIWKTIPLLNAVESNWALVAGLVPAVELKGFRAHQHII